jgi:small nuclear ribonucleoprotein (snRNP)-like protein
VETDKEEHHSKGKLSSFGFRKTNLEENHLFFFRKRTRQPAKRTENRKIRKMLFYSFFKTLVGQTVTVEMKNDIQIVGKLVSVDQYLNIKLEDIEVKERHKYPHLVLHLPTFVNSHR